MAIVLAVLAAAFGASAWAKAHPPALAVAAVERVPVHYGTNEDEAVRFELYEGDRVAVDRRADGWARVNISSGERGWARESDLVFVGPPYEASTRAIVRVGAIMSETFSRQVELAQADAARFREIPRADCVAATREYIQGAAQGDSRPS